MSFQIFAISERSNFWKQIDGKFLKANRWKIFESFLKAFWKLKRWKNFESKSLENFWKQIAGKFLKANRWKVFEIFLKANRWKIFESFLNALPYCFAMAAVRLGRIPLHLCEKIVRLINGGTPQREVHRHRTEKKCYFADPLPVYFLITVKTNARVNTRGSKMLPTNRAMR